MTQKVAAFTGGTAGVALYECITPFWVSKAPLGDTFIPTGFVAQGTADPVYAANPPAFVPHQVTTR